MWILVVLTLLNGALPNDFLITQSAIKIAGVPINVLDWTLFLSVIIAIAYPKSMRFHTDRIHPVLWPVTLMFFVAMLLSSFKSFTGQFQIDSSWYLKTLRHFATFPATIVLGYFLLPSPKAAKAFIYVLILAGLCSAVMIILFFKGKGEELSGFDVMGLNTMRTIQYCTSYASLAVALLVFSVFSGIRLFPVWLSYVIAGICLIGVFVTLTRSDWLAAFACIACVYFLVPRDRRNGLAIKACLTAFILSAFLWMTVMATSAIMKNDFAAKMGERLMTMVPWSTDSVGAKAWDTRTPGMKIELGMFADSPIVGEGFGCQYAQFYLTGQITTLRHNAFTSVMAETGLSGLIPVLISFWVLGVVGFRTVRAQADQGTVLIGALGFISAFHFSVLGMSTMSFNNERLGIVIGMICGMVMRARVMQETLHRMWAGYLPEQTEDHIADPMIDEMVMSGL